MELRWIGVLLIVGMLAAVANAVIDPDNPDWIMYRDSFGDTTAGYYDYYQEVQRGETFTAHWVVNRNPPAGVAYQVGSYHSAFWWDPAVVNNLYNGDGSIRPLPDYTLSWMQLMANPAVAQYEVGIYAQLYNWNFMGSAQNMWDSGDPENPFVVLSWDIPIREDAPLGESTLALRFIAYDILGYRMSDNEVWEGQELTINVVPEPATLSVLALGAAGLLRRRK